MNFTWVVGIALVGVIGFQLLRRYSPETASFLPLTSVILLLFALLPQMETILSALQELGQKSGIEDGSFALILRGVGIGFITQIASGICCDCGQKALGETVDYCGQIAIVSLAVPLILELAGRILETEF
ncbi:MAG: hypothetical protein J6B86_00235 [Clostridia bacterium]|nr:hypothetical protein [Clostridia bacterium]